MHKNIVYHHNKHFKYLIILLIISKQSWKKVLKKKKEIYMPVLLNQLLLGPVFGMHNLKILQMILL